MTRRRNKWQARLIDLCVEVLSTRGRNIFFLENSNPFLVRFVGGWNSPTPPVRGLAFACNSCVWVGILLQLLYYNPFNTTV